jgi:RimJ/RimL family protein N-acetyltransferase
VEPSSLRATYLSGPTVYLRAPVESDKEHAAAWLDDTFPINTPAAEQILKDDHRRPFWDRSSLRLVIVRRDGDAVVGGIRVFWGSEARRCQLDFSMARAEPDADALRAAALRIAVRWLRDEFEAMVVGTTLGADQVETVQAAEEVGMEHHGTLREWFTRPGARVDALVYEALNPGWVVQDA